MTDTLSLPGKPIVRADAFAHVTFERRDIGAMSRFLAPPRPWLL